MAVMSKTAKSRVNDTLHDFLFARVGASDVYKQWAENYALPPYITDNLAPSKQLRDYQIEAIKHFVYLFESGQRDIAKQLLFNMATGTGKTLVMAACVLYLYEHGYRNFLFLVHQVQILEQARYNFCERKFEKYLFNPEGIKFNGRRIDVREIKRLEDAGSNSINFMFFSTSLLYNRLKEERENGLTAEDFAEHDIVVIADEAHRLNVETKRIKTSAEQTEVLNWESAVMNAVKARPGNMLLEFTATVDLANQKIHEKYRDKIIYKYDFLAFNKDGYSKNVQFLYNYETQLEDQRRHLIVNAVVLSQYRKRLFNDLMNVDINPVVLIKSTKIAKSEDDREFFNGVLESLRPRDLQKLRETQSDQDGLISKIFAWLANSRLSEEEFIAEIQHAFAPSSTLIYNSQKKESPELLAMLDTERSNIRAIFSVNALNEGWDVLSLFDIIHFDISEMKKVSLQDIQLIGRGARYYPFRLPKNYQDATGTAGLFGSYETDRFKRKFDQTPDEDGRILETMFYHFVKTGTFLERLQEELMGEGIINEGVERKVIRMKPDFLASDTYKNGFVLVNRTEKRERTTADEVDRTFKRTIKASSYQLHARTLTDREQNEREAAQHAGIINVVTDFADVLIQKALVGAENGFFRFNNLRRHVVGLESVDDFIEKYLSLYRIQYTFEPGKEIYKLDPEERLQLLIDAILPEVRKAIDIHMPIVRGSKTFRPVSVERVFEKEKALYFRSFTDIDPETKEKIQTTPDERSRSQSTETDNDFTLDIGTLPWYAYDENFGTTEEKKFVMFMDRNIEDLRQTYPGAEVYVVRNELDYWLFNPVDARRFSPDFLIFVNDSANKQLYYQCIVEVKGGHLLEKDAWKESALMSLNEGVDIAFDLEDEDINKLSGGKSAYRDYLTKVKDYGYQEIKPIGLKFYNTNPRDEADFTLDFDTKLRSNTTTPTHLDVR